MPRKAFIAPSATAATAGGPAPFKPPTVFAAANNTTLNTPVKPPAALPTPLAVPIAPLVTPVKPLTNSGSNENMEALGQTVAKPAASIATPTASTTPTVVPPPTAGAEKQPIVATAGPAANCGECGFSWRFCPGCGAPFGSCDDTAAVRADDRVPPKRPVDPFNLWAGQATKQPQFANDPFFWESPPKERVKILKAHWNQLSAQERKPFEDEAAKATAAAAPVKSKRGKDSAKEEPKPKQKRPPTTFMLFSNKHRAEVTAFLKEQQEDPSKNVPMGDVAKELGRRWKELTLEQQKSYAAPTANVDATVEGEETKAQSTTADELPPNGDAPAGDAPADPQQQAPEEADQPQQEPSVANDEATTAAAATN